MDLPKARSLLRKAGKWSHLFGCKFHSTGEEHDCTCGRLPLSSLILGALRCLEPEKDGSRGDDFNKKLMDLPKARELLKGLMARDHLPNCGAYNAENRRVCTCGLESQAAVLHSVLQCLEPDVHSKPIMDLPRVRELLVAANKRPHLPGCGTFVLGGEHNCTCGKRTQDSLILDALKCLEPETPGDQMINLQRVREILNKLKPAHDPHCLAIVPGEDRRCTCGACINRALIGEALKCLGSDEDNSYEEHVRMSEKMEKQMRAACDGWWPPLDRVAAALEKIVGINLFKPGLRPDSPNKKPGADSLTDEDEDLRTLKACIFYQELESRVKIDECRDSAPVSRGRSIRIYDPVTQLTVTLSVDRQKDDTLESAADLRRRALRLLAEKVLKHREESDG